jgi:hypothetical protein
VVVAAGGERSAVAVAQEWVGGQGRAAGGGGLEQAVGEGWADGLPALGVAFLVEPDQASVEVGEVDGEGAAAAAGGFGVQSQQQGVEDGVVAADAGGSVDLGELGGG